MDNSRRDIRGEMTVGVTSYSEIDTFVLNGFNACNVYNFKSDLLREVKNNPASIIEMNEAHSSMVLDQLYNQNLFDGIRKEVVLNTGVERYYKSRLFVHLGNITQRMENISLKINPENAYFLGNDETNKL